MLATAKRTASPFPGLRSFSQDESELFFGREGQCDELARILGKSRFVAVVGTSGSGKSSLVRAGLMTSLESGYLAKAGSRWRFVDMRPGSRPIDNLAAALDAARISVEPVDPVTLRANSLALIEVFRAAYGPKLLDRDENLLLLVDQFEELFRFKARDSSMADRDERAGFVKLLLEVAKQPEIPVYVVITMRSDFLGDCALYRDLPEAINGGQYLIPRMTRDQRREAIEGPIQMAGGTITARLVQRILNEVGEDPDQLPVMQHALMRTWQHWAERDQPDTPIDVPDYDAIGGLSDALSSHADEAYAEASTKAGGRGAEIVKLIFQRLRERDSLGRETRRPTPFRDLCAVTNERPEEVLAVLECFRREGRTFLMPPAGVRLDPEREVDITHESLLRQWERLQGPPSDGGGWLVEEEESRRAFLRLVDRAEQQAPESSDYLRGPLLQLALDWWDKRKPNAAWAGRYSPNFELADRFLGESAQNREREREQEAQRLKSEELARVEQARRDEELKARQIRTGFLNAFAGLALLAAICLCVGFWYVMQQRQAAELANTRLATEEKKAADLKAQESANDAALANTAKERARGLEEKAERERATAVTERGKANIQLLASKAALVGTEDESMLPVSMLLAAESMRRQPLVDNQSIVSSGLSLLPKPLTLPENLSAAVKAVFAGEFLATGQQGFVRIWNPKTLAEAGKFPIEGAPRAMGVSKDGSLVGAAFDVGDKGVVRVWDLHTRLPVGERFTAPHVSYLNVGAGGKLMAYTDEYRYWSSWNDAQGSLRGKPVLDLRGSVAASSDLSTFASFDITTSTMKVENLSTGEQIESWTIPEQIHDLMFDPSSNDRFATFADNGTIKIWTVKSRQASITLQAGIRATESTSAIQFSADGQFLAATRLDGTVRVWDTREGKEVARGFLKQGDLAIDGANRMIAFLDGKKMQLSKMPGVTPPGQIRAAHIAANGTQALLQTSGRRTLTVWNLVGDQAEDEVDVGPAASVLAVSPDQRFALGYSQDKKSLLVVRVESGKSATPVRTIVLDRALIPGKLLFSNDGKYVGGSFVHVNAAARERKVILWEINAKNGAPVTYPDSADLLGFTPEPDHCVVRVLLPDGKTKDLKLWDFRKHVVGSAPAQFDESVKRIAFSPDGGRLATFSDVKEQQNTVTVWHWPEAGKPVRIIVDGALSQMSFSTGHQYLLTAGSDRFVRVWDAATGKEAGIVAVQQPLAVGFGAGDQRIVAFGQDRIMDSLWRPSDLLKETCLRVGRSLTPEEWKRYLPAEPYHKTCP